MATEKQWDLINKWDVVSKLIQLENNYQFYKEQWDADVLYRRICELEVGIGKTTPVDAVEVVRCKDCKFAYINSFSAKQEKALCNRHFNHYGNAVMMGADDFCSYGERGTDV